MWRLFSVIQGPQSVGGFSLHYTQTFSLLVIISFLTNYASLPACWKDDIRIRIPLGSNAFFISLSLISSSFRWRCRYGALRDQFRVQLRYFRRVKQQTSVSLPPSQLRLAPIAGC